VASAFFAAVGFGNGIGAVQGVVQGTPAGVGGVQGVTGVLDRYHQLRAGNVGDLVIDVFGGDLEVRAFRQQVADLGQEGFVFGHIDRLAGTGLVPRVDLGLNGIPLGQQRFVLRNQVSQDFFELGPEDIRLHTGARGNFIGNQVVKNSCDLKTAFFDALRHVVCLDRWLSCLENRKVLP